MEPYDPERDYHQEFLRRRQQVLDAVKSQETMEFSSSGEITAPKGLPSMSQPYDYYNRYGGGYYLRFVTRNPDFDTQEFESFVAARNKGDRDSGELGDIAKHEVLRLAAEFAEERWRFPNIHGEPVE